MNHSRFVGISELLLDHTGSGSLDIKRSVESLWWMDLLRLERGRQRHVLNSLSLGSIGRRSVTRFAMAADFALVVALLWLSLGKGCRLELRVTSQLGRDVVFTFVTDTMMADRLLVH